MAVNSQHQLGMNNNQVSKALEKLSSGYRINLLDGSLGVATTVTAGTACTGDGQTAGTATKTVLDFSQVDVEAGATVTVNGTTFELVKAGGAAAGNTAVTPNSTF